MSSFALPSKFALVFNPNPQEPSEFQEGLLFVAGMLIGLILGNLFPIRF